MKTSYHHGDLASALVGEAISQLSSYGPDAITLRSVCGALGVSQSAAYHHFRNKEALLQAMAVQGELELTRRFKAALRGINEISNESAIYRFDSLGRAYINFAIEEPHLFTLTFGPMCVNRASTAQAESMLILRASISELAERKLISARNIEALSLLAWTSVHGFSQLLISGLLTKDLVDSLITAIRELILIPKDI